MDSMLLSECVVLYGWKSPVVLNGQLASVLFFQNAAVSAENCEAFVIFLKAECCNDFKESNVYVNRAAVEVARCLLTAAEKRFSKPCAVTIIRGMCDKVRGRELVGSTK